MATTRTNTTLREAPNAKKPRSPLNSTSAGRATAQTRPLTSAGRPEWTTERWKLQVEAEARGQLKKIIRDIGSER